MSVVFDSAGHHYIVDQELDLQFAIYQSCTNCKLEFEDAWTGDAEWFEQDGLLESGTGGDLLGIDHEEVLDKASVLQLYLSRHEGCDVLLEHRFVEREAVDCLPEGRVGLREGLDLRHDSRVGVLEGVHCSLQRV